MTAQGRAGNIVRLREWLRAAGEIRGNEATREKSGREKRGQSNRHRRNNIVRRLTEKGE